MRRAALRARARRAQRLHGVCVCKRVLGAGQQQQQLQQHSPAASKPPASVCKQMHVTTLRL